MGSNDRNHTIHRLATPFILAGGLLSTQCGSPDAASLPGPQAKESVSRPASLVGMDGPFAAAKAGEKVNTYAPLSANAKTGDTTVTVTGATNLKLAKGDLIMVIQMQGAEVDLTTVNDGTKYGAVSNYRSAGLYEIAGVAAVDNNTGVITLDGCGGLKNNYTAAGHAQVVRVPQYTTLDVPTGTSITGDAWDGAKGGVVAMYVKGKTNLVGKIDASALGFRGGAVDNTTTGTVAAFVNFASKNAADGAEHGESIAGSSVEYDAATGKFGRGAVANGGGGGNAHNAGGGGGANGLNARAWTGQGIMLAPNNTFDAAWKLDPFVVANGNMLTNSSGGGRGGYTFGSQDEKADMRAPGATQWGGDTRREVGGWGGRPLDYSPATRAFLGGGGGAGDGNNDAAGAGGIGGGLVFLVTDNIEGTGSIDANGGAGNRTKVGSGGNDAPGGGGGGGIVILSALRRSSAITINANGGVGGSQFINNNESEGPGGGGGGGVIATFVPGATQPNQNVNGGISGTSDSTSVTEFNVNGATNGATGRTVQFALGPGNVLPTVCVPSDLAVTAVHSKGTVAAGNTIELLVTITNSGPQPASAARIIDSITAGLGTINWTCSAVGGATCPAATGTGSIQSISDIPPQGTMTYVLSVPIPAGFTNSINFQGAATPPVGYNDPNLLNNVAMLTLAQGAVPSADLTLNITSIPNPAPPSTPITYNLTVSNRGPGQAGSASFSYTIPQGGTVLPVTPPAGWTCTQTATTVDCNYAAAVPPGALPTVQVTVVPPAGATNVNSSGTVTAGGATDPDASNNTATNDTPIGNFPPADLQIAINSSPNPAMTGQDITYTVRAINLGPTSATGAVMRFSIPANGTVKSFNAPTGWQCLQNGTTIDCSYAGTIAPGALPDVQVVVTPASTVTSLTATAQVLGQGIADSNLANNQASEVTPIGTAPDADLSVVVTTTPAQPERDQPIVYNVVVNNAGPGTATGATFTFDVPPGGTIQKIDAPAGWSCSQQGQQGQQVECWYTGDIAANAGTPTVMITVVPPANADSVPVRATVTPKGAFDPNTGNNTTDTTTDLIKTKLAGGGFAFGCSTAPTPASPGAVAGLFATLLTAVGLRRRRRSSR
jgi:uncharacterized repeat protein (TIGR01451 family)/MYXO-CTERM domain-containing protein